MSKHYRTGKVKKSLEIEQNMSNLVKQTITMAAYKRTRSSTLSLVTLVCFVYPIPMMALEFGDIIIRKLSILRSPGSDM